MSPDIIWHNRFWVCWCLLIPMISIILIMTGKSCASISNQADRLACSTVSVWSCRTVGSHKAGQYMSGDISLNKVHYYHHFCDYFSLSSLFFSLFFIIQVLLLKHAVCRLIEPQTSVPCGKKSRLMYSTVTTICSGTASQATSQGHHHNARR